MERQTYYNKNDIELEEVERVGKEERDIFMI